MRSYVTETSGTSKSGTAGSVVVCEGAESAACRRKRLRRSSAEGLRSRSCSTVLWSEAMAIALSLSRPYLLVGATRPDDHDDRADQQLHVAPERPVGDVQVIQDDHVSERDVRS